MNNPSSRPTPRPGPTPDPPTADTTAAPIAAAAAPAEPPRPRPAPRAAEATAGEATAGEATAVDAAVADREDAPPPGPSPYQLPTRPHPAIGDTDQRRLAFGPDYRLSFAAVPGAGLAALIAIFGTDAVQRFFSVVVVIVLLALVATDFLFAPRLTVSDDGLRVFAPFDRVTLRWEEIESIQARNVRRYGIVSTGLEISAGERLVVLDKRDLAADPWAVAGVIADFRLTT